MASGYLGFKMRLGASELATQGAKDDGAWLTDLRKELPTKTSEEEGDQGYH